jgi:hypothetical protein
VPGARVTADAAAAAIKEPLVLGTHRGGSHSARHLAWACRAAGSRKVGARPILHLVEPVAFIIAPPVAVTLPVHEFAPIDFAPCFVSTEHTSGLGCYGRCLETYRQYINYPD